MKIEIVRTRNKQFRVHIIGDNGEKLFTSETYHRRAGAVKAIAAIVNPRWGAVLVMDKTRPGAHEVVRL